MLEGSQPHTLDSLYTRLAGLFFDVRWHEPDESTLRELTRRLRPSGILVVTDCELSAAEVARLLESFPECLFLLTSSTATLRGRGVVHEMDPLSASQARELVRRALGRKRRTDAPQPQSIKMGNISGAVVNVGQSNLGIVGSQVTTPPPPTRR